MVAAHQDLDARRPEYRLLRIGQREVQEVHRGGLSVLTRALDVAVLDAVDPLVPDLRRPALLEQEQVSDLEPQGLAGLET
jgi:hypothetical protein